MPPKKTAKKATTAKAATGAKAADAEPPASMPPAAPETSNDNNEQAPVTQQ